MSLATPFATLVAAALGAANPAVAQQAAPAAPAPASPVPAAPVPAASTPSFSIPLTTTMGVSAYYQRRPTTRLWFKPGSTDAGLQLVEILKRGELDGLVGAPALAAQVEAALAAGRSTDVAAQLAAERLLSAAWVLYVQALKQPVPGVEYGDRSMAPRVPTAEWVLMQAEHSPSLAQHLKSVSDVNPVYSQLRDAGWAQVEAGQPADARLLANLRRARVLPAKGRYILVDIATARLWMYDDGKPPESMKVIVGKRDTPTPMIASTISYATFNPYWNVPTDVTKRLHAKEILKKGAAKYLKSNRFEVASDWTDEATVVPPDEVDWKAVAAGDTQVRIRQLPGKNNMMGALKFNFPNSTGIYLHDTPQRGLFAKDKRNFSLGCIRVEDAKRLAAWLLGAEPVAPSAEPEQHVQLPKGVPVYVTYLTASAEGGQLTFVDDVYGLDSTAGAEHAAAR